MKQGPKGQLGSAANQSSLITYAVYRHPPRRWHYLERLPISFLRLISGIVIEIVRITDAMNTQDEPSISLIAIVKYSPMCAPKRVIATFSMKYPAVNLGRS